MFTTVGESVVFYGFDEEGQEQTFVSYVRHNESIVVGPYRLEFYIRPVDNVSEFILYHLGRTHSVYQVPGRLHAALRADCGTQIGDQFVRLLRAPRNERTTLPNGVTVAPGCGASASYGSDREPFTVVRVGRGETVRRVVVRRARAVVEPGTGGYGAERYTFFPDNSMPEETAIYNAKRNRFYLGGVKSGIPISFNGYGAYRDPHF
jgi:hypothetical protein